MPSPLKERYQIPDTLNPGNIEVRIPCDNMKVADTIVCSNFIVYCSKPDDLVVFAV